MIIFDDVTNYDKVKELEERGDVMLAQTRAGKGNIVLMSKYLETFGIDEKEVRDIRPKIKGYESLRNFLNKRKNRESKVEKREETGIKTNEETLKTLGTFKENIKTRNEKVKCED